MLKWKKVYPIAKILSLELEVAQKKNAKFSLRSFAKRLGVSPSFLGAVMLAKKKISVEMAAKMSKKLNWSADDQDFFCLLAEMEMSEPKTKTILKTRAETKLSRLNTWKAEPKDELTKITWEHLLLLVCIQFRPQADLKSVQSFGIFVALNATRVQNILQELMSAKLIVKKDDEYRLTKKQVVIASIAGNPTLRKIHSLYLGRALKMIEQRSPDTRYSATEFFAIPRHRLPGIQSKINDLLDEIGEYAREKPKDGVAEIAIHLNYFSQEEIFPVND
jgi:uncharacterized protein (TIGR02147 family)